MRLVLNDNLQFSVASFQEFLELQENNIQMRVTVNVAYTESLETLVSKLDGVTISAFEISDLDSGNKRSYTDFEFDSINQSINDFHNIETSLVFVKNINKA